MNIQLHWAMRADWRRHWREKRHWLVALGVILLATAYLMRNWLSAGLPTSARREVLTELTIVWMFRDELAQGHLITGWNPYWFSGFPWLRFLSYPVYYAAAAASFWGGLSLEVTLKVFFITVMAGSGMAMYGLVRKLCGDWRAALVGALIYEFVPFHAHVGVETWIHAAFWMLLPLPLWSIEYNRAKPNRRSLWLLLTGLFLGLYPIISSEYAILAGPFVVLYIVARELIAWGSGQQSLAQALKGLILVGAVALGVAAFFVLPAAMEIGDVGIHAKHAGGTTFANELIRNYSITPRLVWYAIVRRLGLAASIYGLPSIVQSFWSVAWYPGLMAPLLALLGIVFARKRLAVHFAVVGLAFAVLLITGPTFALNVFNHIPVLGRLSPFRGLMLVVLFGAVLSAYGAKWLLGRVRRPWLGYVLTCGLIVFIGIDYGGSAQAFQVTDAYFSSDEQVVYDWLSERQDKGRLWEPAYLPRDQYLRSYSLSRLPMRRYVGYYDNGAPLHTWQQTAWSDLSTALSLHQVRYVLLHDDEPDTPERENALEEAGYELAFGSGPVWIWENSGNGQYAKLYNQAAVDLGDDIYRSFAALPRLLEKDIAMVAASPALQLEDYDYWLGNDVDLEPYQTEDSSAVPSSERLISLGDIGNLSPEANIFSQVWADRLAWDDIYVEVQSLQPLVLTVSESWYPHWRVEVDGQPGQVLRVNWALLGTRLDSGMHRVRFTYERPWHVYIGYAITLLTLMGLALWGARYLAVLVNRSPSISMDDLNEDTLASLRREAMDS